MTQLLLDFSETLKDADGDTVVVDRLSDGQPEQVEKLKKMAAREGKTVSAFILEKTGINHVKGESRK